MRRLGFALIFTAVCFPVLSARAAEDPRIVLAEASGYVSAMKWEKAATTLEKFLTQFPTNENVGRAAFTLGQCYVELKNYDKAIPAFEKAVNSHDANILSDAELGLADAAMSAKKYDKAVPALDAAVKTKLKPDDAARAWFQLGEANFQLKHYAPAEEAYGHVVSDYGMSVFADPAAFDAGVSALRQKKTEAARKDLSDFIEKFPKSANEPMAVYLVAQMDVDAKQYAAARTSLESLMKDPRAAGKLHDDAEDVLIDAELKTGDLAAAIPHLGNALKRLPEKDPQRYKAALFLGNCNYQLKQYPQALTAYKEAAKSPEAATAGQAQYWAAESLLADGNISKSASELSQAADQFKAFVTHYPNDALASHAQLRQGDAYLASKQNKQAVIAYHDVTVHYPKSKDADEAKKGIATALDGIKDKDTLVQLTPYLSGDDKSFAVIKSSRGYIAEKNYTKAVTEMTKYLKGNPDPASAGEAYYLLGVSYDALSKPDLALEALAHSVRQAPKAPFAADAQVRLAVLYLSEKKPEPDKAETAATAALASSKDLTPVMMTQAQLAQIQAYYDQQKWEQTMQSCQALLDTHPAADTATTAIYTMAIVNEKRKKPDEALVSWDKLAKDYPKSNYTAEALLALGNNGLKTMKYDMAREQFKTLLTNFPQNKLAPKAHLGLGYALYDLNNFENAANEFDTVAGNKSAGATDHADALYWAGIAFDKSKKYAEAIKRFSTLIAEYPQSTHILDAKIKLAKLKAANS